MKKNLVIMGFIILMLVLPCAADSGKFELSEDLSNGNSVNEMTGEIYVTDVSAGVHHTVLLLSDGSARAYGDNQKGQCEVGDWKNLISIKAGRNSTLGLRDDGTMLITPDEDHGEWIAALKDIRAFDVYGDTILALDSAGTVHAIGRYGEMLDGAADIREISVGNAYAAALMNDGTPIIIGNGDGGLVNLAGSERFPAEEWKDIRSISNGGYILTAEKSDGQVLYGPGSLSVLFPQSVDSGLFSSVMITDSGAGYIEEDGTACFFDRDLENPADISRNVSKFSIGSYGFYVVLHTDGTVSVFGDNYYGECDIDPEFRSKVKVIDIAAGGGHAVLLLEDGTVRAFAESSGRELNTQSWTDIVQVSAGPSHTVGLKSDGTVVCSGRNDNNQCDVSEWRNIKTIAAGSAVTLGLDENGMVYSTDSLNYFFLPIPGHAAIAAGTDHAAAVFSDGTGYCTGRNEHGRMDIGDWTDIVRITASEYNTFGVRADGTVAAAGYNAYGQADVEDLSGIVQAEGGMFHSLFLKSDGTVIVKGGLEDAYDNSCMNVEGWTDIVKIAASDYLTIGLRSDGTVVSTDEKGIIPGEYLAPIEEQTDTEVFEEDEIQAVEEKLSVIDVDADIYTTVLLLSDGTARAYGDNKHGQCEVYEWSGLTDIDAGGNFTLGLKNDGTVVSTFYNSRFNEWVENLTDIQAVSVYGNVALALDSSGTVYGFGGRSDLLDELTNVKEITAGYFYLTALKDDGTPVIIGEKKGKTADLTGSDVFPAGQWRDIDSISNGGRIITAKKKDGSILASGMNYQTLDADVREDIESGNISYISEIPQIGGYLRRDGSVYSRIGIMENKYSPVSGLENISRISISFSHIAALHDNGTVSVFGNNDYGQCDIDPEFLHENDSSYGNETEEKFTPKWEYIGGSYFYGQISGAGWPNGFVVMESETGSSYGVNKGSGSINNWNGTVISVIRDEKGIETGINIIRFNHGKILNSHRFFADGSMNYVNFVSNPVVRIETNKNGTFSRSEQAPNGLWKTSNLIPRNAVPREADLFYTDVVVTLDEQQEGRLHYGNYEITAVDQNGEAKQLLKMQVSEDGSVSINWKGMTRSYDAQKKLYTK